MYIVEMNIRERNKKNRLKASSTIRHRPPVSAPRSLVYPTTNLLLVPRIPAEGEERLEKARAIGPSLTLALRVRWCM
jgi:hypothetical protein